MRLTLIFLVLFLTNCCDSKPSPPDDRTLLTQQYGMKCSRDLTIRSPYTIVRCENDEVSCYVMSSAMNCRLKKKEE